MGRLETYGGGWSVLTLIKSRALGSIPSAATGTPGRLLARTPALLAGETGSIPVRGAI